MRCGNILPAGSWDARAAIDAVVLDYDMRRRRRIVLTTEAGASLLLDLERPAHLREGDGLATEAGVVVVRARPEALLEIHAHDTDELVRIAWHLGNRHLPVQLLPGRLRIRADHVIADMVRGLGGHASGIAAPFDPEEGAYAPAGAHHHAHDHE